jgi:hypothetical protein
MKELPKRTIEELIQLHRLQRRSMQELFVEGATDKQILEDVLAACGLGHVAVYEIGTVDIPFDEIFKLRLNDGNRSRVIALAALLEDHVKQNELVCFADADTNFIRNHQLGFSLLLYTDATSIEAYAMDEAVIERFLKRSARSFPKDAKHILQDLHFVLQQIFLRRATCEELELPASFKHDLTESLQFDRKLSSATIRIDHYEARMFAGLTHPSSGDPFRTRLGELVNQLPNDPKKCVHGHDLEKMFGWYIRKHSGFGSLHAETISKMFLQLLDTSYLLQQPAFAELQRRLR